MCMVALCGYAQKSYPKDVLTPVESEITKVKFKGAAPGICDFITTLNNQEEGMFMDSGNVIDSWNHYLNNEKQEPGADIIVDKKNGYVCQSFYFSYEINGETREEKATCEMCYWNCADGKHKLIAENVISMMDGKYVIGQYSGTMFFLYDNATRKMWAVDDELIGAYVEPVIDEANCQTGKEMTVSGETVAVYSLPQQGKDINVVVYRGNKKTEARLVWDGMRFKQQ